jgi:hypothetical protein
VLLKRRVFVATAIVAACASAPSYVVAQAFTAPEGVGSVTVAWQWVDNTGHRGSDGFLVARGQSITSSALVEVDYGVTDRLSATFSIPYVFAKYTGALPSFSRLPVDECACWHSAFQDLSLAVRYRLGDETRALTPIFKYDRPSHDYPYAGEAVVGRNLQEVQIGLSGGLRLAGLLAKATVQGGYTYAFVEKAIDEIPIDRSNGSMEFGYAVTRALFVRGSGTWQRTHGGLRAGSASGIPFPLPGELNTPDRFAQRDRITRSNYWHAGGGISYNVGPADLWVSIDKYIWGTDTHNGQAYTVGSTWYFDRSK